MPKIGEAAKVVSKILIIIAGIAIIAAVGQILKHN